MRRSIFGRSWSRQVTGTIVVSLIGLFLLSGMSPAVEAAQVAQFNHAAPMLPAFSGETVDASEAGLLSASAASAVPTPATTTSYSGWWGWDGNRAVYPTMDAIPTYLSSAENSSFAYQTTANASSTDVANSALVSLSTTGSNASWYAYQAGGVGSGFTLNTLFTGFGASTVYADVNPRFGTVTYSFVDYENAIEQVSNLPPSTYLDLLTAYDSGINMTLGNAASGSSGNELTSAMSLALDVAEIALMDAGEALDPATLLLDIMVLIGGNNCSPLNTVTGPSPSGNESVNQWSQVQYSTSPPSQGWNGFGQSDYVRMTIPTIPIKAGGSFLPRIDGNGGSFEIGAVDQIGDASDCGSPNVDASQVTLTYPIWPAVSIGGHVDLYPGGPAASDAAVQLAQSCPAGMPSTGSVDYDLTTNSAGYWHFFTDPGCTYVETATGPSTYQSGTLTSLPVTLPAADTGLLNEGNNSTVPTVYLGEKVAGFTETGLGSGQPGQSWSITLNGSTQSASTGSEIEFLEQNGSYSYSVGGLTGYTPSPASGTVEIPGTTLPVSIAFTKTSTYTASFSEGGLPSGVTWTAEVGSTDETAASGTTISFTGLAGDYTYTIPSVLVKVSSTEDCAYIPNHSSGPVTGAMQLTVTFTKSTKCVTV